MKKKYEKPQILFDSFELSQDIAAGCRYDTTNQVQYVCPAIDPELGMSIFAGGNCDMTPPSGNDRICYHVPTAGNNVFGS